MMKTVKRKRSRECVTTIANKCLDRFKKKYRKGSRAQNIIGELVIGKNRERVKQIYTNRLYIVCLKSTLIGDYFYLKMNRLHEDLTQLELEYCLVPLYKAGVCFRTKDVR